MIESPGRRHLVLVGLPGAGKTTVGQLVAERLGAIFHDIDPLIERELGLPVREIFANVGEDAFRSVESRTVMRLLEAEAAIIAPGGGWVVQPGNLTFARNCAAFLVYLTASAESVAHRTAGDSSRPLLATNDRLRRIRELMADRESYYLQSDATVSTDDRSAVAVADDVAALARSRAGW